MKDERRLGVPIFEKTPPPQDHHWPPDLLSRITRPWDTRPFVKARGDAAPGIPRVLVLGFTDTRGGAGLAASRLISRLRRDGSAEVLQIVSRQQSENPWTVSMDRAHRFLPWRHLRKAIAARNVLLSDPYGWLPFEARYVLRAAEIWQPDIIHVHNLHGGQGTFPVELMPQLARHATDRLDAARHVERNRALRLFDGLRALARRLWRLPRSFALSRPAD